MELLDILKKIINEEFLVLKEKIINNIISQGLSASGSTVDSLEIQEFESSVALLGRKCLFAPESVGATSPQDMRKIHLLS